MSRFFLFLIFLAFVSLKVSYSQKSKSELEKEKQANQKKIEEANKILGQTKQKKKATLGQLSAINRQIAVRQSLIRSISREVRKIGVEVEDINTVISSMEKDLEKLKEEYADMLYSAAKASSQYNQLLYLFSSSSFNELRLRINYLDQISEIRENQVRQIRKVREALERQKEALENTREKRRKLLYDKKKEAQRLSGLKSKQSEIISELGEREEELKKEIERVRRENEKIEQLIARIIKAEIKKSKQKTSSGKTLPLTPEAKLISDNFAENKKSLPWPVTEGFISGKFGKQPHPVLRGVKIDNLGVNIQTTDGQKVRAVFSGTVMSVSNVQGTKLVLIQHGDYFTLYSKLDRILVSKGDKVQAKQTIGTVRADTDGVSEMQFQIWKNFNKLNPEEWLFKK